MNNKSLENVWGSGFGYGNKDTDWGVLIVRSLNISTCLGVSMQQPCINIEGLLQVH